MSQYNFDAPRIGTADTLKPYRRVDSRQCPRCGAVAGRCAHLAADEDVIWISKSKEKPVNAIRAWSEPERAEIVRLFRAGYTSTQIADAKNTTRAAICGLLKREGVRR